MGDKKMITTANHTIQSKEKLTSKSTLSKKIFRFTIGFFFSLFIMIWEVISPIINKVLTYAILGCAAGAYLFQLDGNEKAFYICFCASILSLVLKVLIKQLKLKAF